MNKKRLPKKIQAIVNQIAKEKCLTLKQKRDLTDKARFQVELFETQERIRKLQEPYTKQEG